MDKLLVACTTHVLADSHSQATFLDAEGVCDEWRIEVFGAGSISGVDLKRFCSDSERRNRIRIELDVPVDAPVFLFLGRLHQEKGVIDLSIAFSRLALEHSGVHMLWVGPDEGHLASLLGAVVRERTRVVGLTPRPEDYLDASDVLILPSYREGFGTVVIEAAAMGRPTIGTNIYGLTDAIVDGKTGLLVPVGDVDALTDAMRRMLDRKLIERLGAGARERAQLDFGAEVVTEHWVRFYLKNLKPAK
jgi:glycosyltransferase involved in cell wall biosynthesis